MSKGIVGLAVLDEANPTIPFDMASQVPLPCLPPARLVRFLEMLRVCYSVETIAVIALRRAIIVSGGVRISYLSRPVNRVSSRQSTSVHNRLLSSHSGTVATEFSRKYTHSSLGLRRLLRGLEFTVRLLLSAYFSLSIKSQFGWTCWSLNFCCPFRVTPMG